MSFEAIVKDAKERHKFDYIQVGFIKNNDSSKYAYDLHIRGLNSEGMRVFRFGIIDFKQGFVGDFREVKASKEDALEWLQLRKNECIEALEGYKIGRITEEQKNNIIEENKKIASALKIYINSFK